MVARRAANDAIGELSLGQAGNLVVGAAELEREYRLQVFALHQDLVA